MYIRCGRCEVSNKVIEAFELDEIEHFYERFLITSKCRVCNNEIAQLIEVRKGDDRVFLNSFYGDEAKKVVSREKKRAKTKEITSNKFFGFVYGINKEIKNKKGEIIKIRQYASDYNTNDRILIKTVFYKN